MEKQFTQHNFPERLIQKFPELKNYLSADDYDEDSSYLTYVHTQALTDKVNKSISEFNSKKLRQLFDFVEEIVGDSDDTVINALGTVFIEHINYVDPIKRGMVIAIMGPKTKEFLEEIEEYHIQSYKSKIKKS